MKTGTIPYPREFGPGDSGVDCRAVKRALAKALDGPHGMNLKTNSFSKAAQVALQTFKRTHGLVADPIYTAPAHLKLEPDFDEYGGSLMVRMERRLVAQKQRDAIVAEYRWMIDHHAEFHYAQVRPIPLHLSYRETSQPIYTDCSGSITLAAKWAGVPDPNGFGFNGAGNTGSMLAHGQTITQGQLQRGDVIVYRKGSWDTYGHHVVIVLDRSGGNINCGSDGRDGCPCETTHADEASVQASLGYPQSVFKRFLPALV